MTQPEENGLPPGTLARLEFLAAGDPKEKVSFEQLAQVLGTQAFGMLLLIVALPCSIPMPPGIGTLCGILTTLISVQMLIGRSHLWLPHKLGRRTMQRSDFQRIVRVAGPWLGRLERLCRPRLTVMTGPLGRVLLGGVILVLGLIIVLPIPGANMAPGIAILFLALGLSERDGVIVSVGIALAVAALGVTVWLLVWGAQATAQWLGA